MKSRIEQETELIEKLKTEYVSTQKKKLGVTYSDTYTETKEFDINYLPAKFDGNEVCLKKGQTLYFVFIAFFTIEVVMGLYNAFKPRMPLSDNLHLFYGPLGLIVTVIKFFRRRKILILNRYGIYHYKWENFVSWSDVVICFLRTKTDDGEDSSNTSHLIIHYFSKHYNIIVQDSILISNLDKTPADIASLIEFFKNKTAIRR